MPEPDHKWDMAEPGRPGEEAAPPRPVPRGPELEIKPRTSGADNPWGSAPGKEAAVWDEDPAKPIEVAKPMDPDSETGVKDAEERIKRSRKEDTEHLWGWQQRHTLWWVLSGLAAIVVVAFFLIQNKDYSKPSARVETPDRFVSTTTVEETPVSALLTLGQSAIPRLVEIVRKAESGSGEAEQVLAGGAETVAKMEPWRALTGRKAAVKEDGVIGLMAAGFGNQGYLLMSGLRNDYTKYLAYFVEVEGELRLDWNATVGYCTLLPEEVMTLRDGEEVDMRVIADPSSFYTAVFPEDDYVCLLLSHFDREQYAWGYVRRGSEEHALLEKYLGSPVTMMTAGRLRIRVTRGPEGAMPKQVEVVGILGPDWLEVDGGEGEEAGEEAAGEGPEGS